MLNFKAKETEIFFRIKDQIDFPCSFIRASIERISKDPFLDMPALVCFVERKQFLV